MRQVPLSQFPKGAARSPLVALWRSRLTSKTVFILDLYWASILIMFFFIRVLGSKTVIGMLKAAVDHAR